MAEKKIPRITDKFPKGLPRREFVKGAGQTALGTATAGVLVHGDSTAATLSSESKVGTVFIPEQLPRRLTIAQFLKRFWIDPWRMDRFGKEADITPYRRDWLFWRWPPSSAHTETY